MTGKPKYREKKSGDTTKEYDSKQSGGTSETSAVEDIKSITKTIMKVEIDSQEKLSNVAELIHEREKTKDVQSALEENGRLFRTRLLGNIRFLGELYKKKMLSTRVIFLCINDLIKTPHEENLECLCAILMTVGEFLESRPSTQDGLDSWFVQLAEWARNGNRESGISSRIRSMIQDVIDSRAQWKCRLHDVNESMMIPKTQKETVCRRRTVQSKTTEKKKPKKFYRPRGCRKSTKKVHCDPHLVKNATNYAEATPTVVAANKCAVPRDFYGNLDPRANTYALPGDRDGNLDRRPNNYTLPRGVYGNVVRRPPVPGIPWTSIPAPGNTGSLSSTSSNIPRKTVEQFKRVVKSMTDYVSRQTYLNSFKQEILERFHEYFDESSYELFVRESINNGLNGPSRLRRQLSELFSYMVKHNVLPLSLIQSEFGNILEFAGGMPKIWTYVAELLEMMVILNAHPLAEMKITAAFLKSGRGGGKLLGELLAILVRDRGSKWVKEKWDQSELQWSDVTNEKLENVDDIIKKYGLEFLDDDGESAVIDCEDQQVTDEQVDNDLAKSMPTHNIDQISDWILEKVRTPSDPQFIRDLMTKIVGVPVEERYAILEQNANNFKDLQNFIKSIIDASTELELQWLEAIQAYNHKLEHPPEGLEFLNDDGEGTAIDCEDQQGTDEQVDNDLAKSMPTHNFDQISDWIREKVKNPSDPQFVRDLMTKIVGVPVEERYAILEQNENNFKDLQNFVKRFIDASTELELQWLEAIQAYNHKLELPPEV